MDVSMGSQHCRQRFPRIGGRPGWLDQWQREIDEMDQDVDPDDDDDEDPAAAAPPPLGRRGVRPIGNVEEEAQETAGEHQINMLRGPPPETMGGEVEQAPQVIQLGPIPRPRQRTGTENAGDRGRRGGHARREVEGTRGRGRR